MTIKKRAVVLVSGGLDSATTLAIALRDGFTPVPVSFDYGQRHAVELQAAAKVCESLGVSPPRLVSIDLRSIGGSALTADISVPKGRSDKEIETGIPVTYVPARNTVFLSYALALAETVDALDIFIGVNAVDYSGYPDCRPEFIEAFERLANLATRAGAEGKRFSVHAPLLNLEKAEIIKLGVSLRVDFALTHSCYDPVGILACGQCDSCLLRMQGFQKAAISDPTAYADP